MKPWFEREAKIKEIQNRSNEKRILRFLKNCNKRVEHLADMTRAKALAEVENWADSNE